MKKRLLSILTIATLAGGFIPAVNAQPSSIQEIAQKTFKVCALCSGVPVEQLDIRNNNTSFNALNHPSGLQPSTLSIFGKTIPGISAQVAALVALYKHKFPLAAGLYIGGFALHNWGFKQAQNRK